MLCANPRVGNLSKLQHYYVTPWLKTETALCYPQNIILVPYYGLGGSLLPGTWLPHHQLHFLHILCSTLSESLLLCPAFLFVFHAIPSGWCYSLWVKCFSLPCPPNTFQHIGLSSTGTSSLNSSLTLSKQIGCCPSYHPITCHRYLD